MRLKIGCAIGALLLLLTTNPQFSAPAIALGKKDNMKITRSIPTATSAQNAEVWLPEGSWEFDDGDTLLELMKLGNYRYSVVITEYSEYTPGGNWICYEWSMTGQYDPKTGVLTYSDCTLSSGWEDSHTEYQNGTGTLIYMDNILYWLDDQDSTMAYKQFPLSEEVWLPEGYLVGDNLRTSITVELLDNNLYSIQIDEGGIIGIDWFMTGQYNPKTGILTYSDCTSVEFTWEDENMESTIAITRYENGTGKLIYRNGYLYWIDDQDDAGNSIRFEYYEIIDPD